MLRALEDPSKSRGPIQVPSRDPDGRDMRTGREERRPETLAWGESSRAVHGLPVPRPNVRSKALRSMYRRSCLRPRPPPETNVCTYAPNLSKQEAYILGRGVLHVQETRTMQRYLSIQQCTSSNSEKGGEKREGLSPAYVSANGSRLQTPAHTSLYWVVWRYGKLYGVYGKSAGCKPLTCNLDCWLIYNNNQVLLVVSK